MNIIKQSVLQSAENSKYFKYIIFEDVVTSTQTIAKEKLFEIENSFVVSSLHQTQGVGRFKREFESPDNCGFYSTFVVRPNVNRDKLMQFNLFIALAITKTIERFINRPIGIKWPNDIYVEGKKLCGFLTEMIPDGQFDTIVCGIGVNIFNSPSEVGKKAALETFADEEIDVGAFVKTLFQNIEKYYDLFLKNDFSMIRDTYVSYSTVLGKEIIITTPSEQYEATAIDIDDFGILRVIDRDSQIKSVLSADIEE